MKNNKMIMNEYNECLDLLTNGLNDKNLYQSLNLLARYYYYDVKLSNYEIYIKLKEFLVKNLPNYSDKKYNKILEYYSEVHRCPVSKVDKIEILQEELDIIQSLSNKNLKNIAFTLLCVAKYNYCVNPKNNYWTNLTTKQLATLSKVKEKNEILYDYIHELYLLKLIKFSKNICSTSILVLFVKEPKNNELPAITINNFDNIIKDLNIVLKKS